LHIFVHFPSCPSLFASLLTFLKLLFANVHWYWHLFAGSLAIPLALRGAEVHASDISGAMAGEAERRYKDAVTAGAAAPKVEPRFETSDLE
jgi:hypothetical protein